jgi:oligopeptide transport system ATP-binding protein
MDTILSIKNLFVSFDTYAGEVQALRGFSFDLAKGERLAIVGESGSGKSVTVQSVMRLIPSPPSRVKNGSILFDGEEILSKTDDEMRRIRGAKIGMIFQDPMSSLNPTMTVGMQIAEALMIHEHLSKKAALKKSVEILSLVNIPNPEKRAAQYPHEFSGGMRQRVMIAIALSCNPMVLVADEPTTSLDVTIQAQILDLIRSLKQKLGMSVILITHDMGVVADFAERVIVMYGGKIMEESSVVDLFDHPAHPYTKGLLNSVPRPGQNKGSELYSIEGTPPDLLNPPTGCPFAPRCEYAMVICREEAPDFFETGSEHKSACWLHHYDAGGNT